MLPDFFTWGVHLKKLIVNADDLGLTEGVTNGIIQAAANGIVTSTSAMMNHATISAEIARAREACPHMGIGLHLVLTEGRPLLAPEAVPGLVNEYGRFHQFNRERERFAGLDLGQVRAEWSTQIESFLGSGFQPDHLDSHHHISYYHPDLFKILLRLAREYHLPIRYPPFEFIKILGKDKIDDWLADYGVTTPSGCITDFYGYDIEINNGFLLGILDSMTDGVHELMCHPGFADQELINNSSYNTPRELELEVLTSPEVKGWIQEQGIQLIPFSKM